MAAVTNRKAVLCGEPGHWQVRAVLFGIRKVWIVAATLVLLTGVAQPMTAQNTAIISGAVRDAVTGSPVADATIRAPPASRSCATGGDGSCRLVVDARQVEVRVTAVGFAPASKSILLASGASTVVAFVLRPSAVPLDQVVTVGTRALERTASQSPALSMSFPVSSWRKPAFTRRGSSCSGSFRPLALRTYRSATITCVR